VSLTLGTIITAARDRHPAFSRERIPDAPVARYLTDVQNELIPAASIRDRQFMAQTAVISVAMDAASAPGAAGAGTSGGVPGIVSGDSFTTSESSTGSAIEVGVTEADGATVLIADSPLTSATPTSLTKTGAGRATNGDIDDLIVITAGKGIGQRRVVTSNAATTWHFAAFDIVPDTTSLFSLVAPIYLSDDTAGAVTGLPSTTQNLGYLVKLDSTGAPYIDYTEPLVATLEQGVPLPSMQALLPDLSQYWTADGCGPRPLTVTNAQQRWNGCGPAVYAVGSTLYLCGRSTDWTDVRSLELRYVPIAPAFTALADLFLLPDHARAVLVAKAASFMAMRVEGLEGVTIDSTKHAAEANRATQDFYRTVLLNTRGRGPNRVREAW
jgi:hypothetical protein